MERPFDVVGVYNDEKKEYWRHFDTHLFIQLGD